MSVKVECHISVPPIRPCVKSASWFGGGRGAEGTLVKVWTPWGGRGRPACGAAWLLVGGRQSIICLDVYLVGALPAGYIIGFWHISYSFLLGWNCEEKQNAGKVKFTLLVCICRPVPADVPEQRRCTDRPQLPQYPTVLCRHCAACQTSYWLPWGPH